jgi:urease accessory protein
MKLATPQLEATARRGGTGQIQVELVAGQSAVISTWMSNPMKILIPRPRGSSVWAYTASFGGGLVAGDQTQLDITVGNGARCFIGTQASTKIYRNPAGLPCSHSTQAAVNRDALLVFAPDPVQAFAESTYTQQQKFHLASGAGLVLVDWFTSGRAARDERWAFARLESRNDVWIEGERVFADAIALDAADEPLTSPHRTGRFNCFALLLLVGPPLRDIADDLLAAVASRPVEDRAPLIGSASPTPAGAVLRVAGESVEDVGRELHRWLQPLSAWLGDDPWARKW